MNKKAMYPGSFDPFTNGHLDIVKKASALFDDVVIIIGVNANKTRNYNTYQMKEAIEKTLRDNNLHNVHVDVYEGLMAEYAKNNNVKYMVRGLRNTMDYDYEENIAEVNKLINPNLEYIYFRAENAAVSSSMVRELYKYGQDVSPFLPHAIFEILSNVNK